MPNPSEWERMFKNYKAERKLWNIRFALPVLSELVGPELLLAMERVAARGQVGKYAGRSITERSPEHHAVKGLGHIAQSGPELKARDEGDTEEMHLVLAALRLLFAAHCAGEVER